MRRQRLAEQEETLKDCQQQTEQLQLWLADIAQTLEHVIRVNDQSQLQVNVTNVPTPTFIDHLDIIQVSYQVINCNSLIVIIGVIIFWPKN